MYKKQPGPTLYVKRGAMSTYWKDEAQRIGLKSAEEIFFLFWLHQLEKHNLVSFIDTKPESLILSFPKKIVVNGKLRSLCRGHVYTPDFTFATDNPFIKSLFKFSLTGVVYVDTKGTGLRNARIGQEFSINQKWVYDKYNIWIEKVVPDDLFKKSFAPEQIRLTPITKRPSKYADFPTFQNFYNKTIKG